MKALLLLLIAGVCFAQETPNYNRLMQDKFFGYGKVPHPDTKVETEYDKLKMVQISFIIDLDVRPESDEDTEIIVYYNEFRYVCKAKVRIPDLDDEMGSMKIDIQWDNPRICEAVNIILPPLNYFTVSQSGIRLVDMAGPVFLYRL